jgi:hypothetical protein
MDWIYLAEDGGGGAALSSCCEHGYELSDSVKGGKFLDWPVVVRGSQGRRRA